jgi:hypothetical protein
MSYDDSEYDRKTGKYGVTEDGTRNEMRRLNQQITDEKTKKPSKDGAVNPTQSPSNLDLHHADTQDVGKTPVGDVSTPQTPNAPKTPDKIRKLPLSTDSKVTAGMEALKSWEAWLTKYVETDSDKELSIEIDTARQTGLKKIPKQRTKPESGVDAKEGEISRINAEKWKSWLEKMQGAGDARFGNQHLTGMEQHPVSDDDSLELSPETEENNEKQDKKEDKEEEDNKPYKALR